MRKYFLTHILTIALLSLSATSYAQEIKVITLKNGSILKGKVLQLKDSIYTLETSDLGEVDIPESNILSITSSEGSSGSSEAQKTEMKKQIEQVQGTILSDPDIMEDIQDILEDDTVKAMLSDPGLLNDVQSFDPNKIQQNQNVQSLMNNPKMQELMNKLQQKIPAQ